MDLVALLAVPAGQDGRTKASGKATSNSTSKITLWRMTGHKVWETDIEGVVGGLAWTIDGKSQRPAWSHSASGRDRGWEEEGADGSGLHLSVLVSKGSGQTCLEHLSVHTGESAKRVVCSSSPSSSSVQPDFPAEGSVWWDLKWISSGEKWPVAPNGSAAKLIDSLPLATPVEPPQAAQYVLHLDREMRTRS